MTDRHVLLIFLDGVGLGADDPAVNPLAAANAPTLAGLAGGQRWLKSAGRITSDRSSFVPTDPRLGMPGRPQSASGQAAILTGLNVPALIGEHYGPRPNPPIRQILNADNLFKRVVAHGDTAALLEAYPPQFHETVNSGKRLLSSYQEALRAADLPLFGIDELNAGEALTVDWTGEGWRTHLGYTDSPLYSPYDAGVLMVELARRYTFSFFAHWISDTIGHRGTVTEGAALIELFDAVMRGALDAWRDDEGLIVITSDHGNLEDVSHGKHTENDVPTVVIGSGHAQVADQIETLADIAPAIEHYLYYE